VRNFCVRGHILAASLRGRVCKVRERGICRVRKFVALASVVPGRRLSRGCAGHRGLDWRARLRGRAIVVIRPPERPSGPNPKTAIANGSKAGTLNMGLPLVLRRIELGGSLPMLVLSFL
jgi:hypothetical protein